MKPSVAVVDYGMGNLRSVAKALEKAGARVRVTSSAKDIRRAGAVVLPGVGAFGEAVNRLKKGGLWNVLQEALAADKPFLDCLGLQLLFDSSEESPRAKGMGYFRGSVVRFRIPRAKDLKVPHMGWNSLEFQKPFSRAYRKGVSPRDYFYFVHSYFPAPRETQWIAATTRYGQRFCSAMARGRLLATQFHPEKSGEQGLRLLKNFVGGLSRC